MNNIDLGRRIKQRRTDLGLTQGDIAAEVGVAISTIQRYETGSIERIKLPVVEAIARALHADLDWLVGKTPKREEGGESMKRRYCEQCDMRELTENAIAAQKSAHDAQIARIVKSDTDIINGLLRKIDALYLLLEEQREHGDDKGEQRGNYIHNCQDMNL